MSTNREFKDYITDKDKSVAENEWSISQAIMIYAIFYAIINLHENISKSGNYTLSEAFPGKTITPEIRTAF